MEYVRTLKPEELPQIDMPPEGTDPLAEGILMQHQKEWLQDTSPLKLCEKGRRCGITWAEALDDTLSAAAQKSAGGGTVFYIGDTKEKGLEFVSTCAHFARILAAHSGAVDEMLFEDQDESGDTKKITCYRIRFASGFQIAALSSRPAGIRGLGNQAKTVVIDEAAFHPRVQATIAAVNALLIWGTNIHIISTHNGRLNAFNGLVNDIRAGLYPYRLHRITFDNAVANGLYERVCLVKGWSPTPAGKQEWYDRIRQSYGSDKSAMEEELDCVPKDSGGKAIPGVWIEAAMRSDRPVFRWSEPDDFAALSDVERERRGLIWIETHTEPILMRLNKTDRWAIGMDYARHRNLSCIAPLSVEWELTRKAPFLIEFINIPTRQQEQVLWHLLDHLSGYWILAIDATGPGQVLAEYTGDKYGRLRVREVMLNDTWYREHMGGFVRAFEDGKFDLPRDREIDHDLRQIESIGGIYKLPKLVEKIPSILGKTRHGDMAIALALGWYASTLPLIEIGDFIPASPSQWRGSHPERDFYVSEHNDYARVVSPFESL
jgi:phage FluMu gp28-like protein